MKSLSLYKYRADKLRAHLVDYSVTEIFSIPQKEDFNQDLVTLDLSSGLKENFISYTIEEYIAHLRNIIHLLEDYENYNVYVESLTNDLGYSVCAKEESGLFLLKNKSPFLCLYIENNDLTKGFWDYLSEIIRNKEMGKKSTISRIKKAIKDLST